MNSHEQAVVDGFCYNLQRPMVPSWYEPMALGQLEALRKAGGFRPRWYGVPEESSGFVIPPYNTVEQQVRITPGSWLYGYMVTPTALNALTKITEGATGIPLSSDFLCTWNIQGDQGQFNLLSQARLIVAPGWVNVEIANGGATPIPYQLVLLCAEPCVVVQDAPQECRQ